MATISLTIPDAALPRVVDALCARGGWTSATGLTKGAFAKKQLGIILREEVRNYELSEAERVALATLVDPGTIDIT